MTSICTEPRVRRRSCLAGKPSSVPEKRAPALTDAPGVESHRLARDGRDAPIGGTA